METPAPRGAAANGTGVTRATKGAMSRAIHNPRRQIALPSIAG
jgi:hypothetical protein